METIFAAFEISGVQTDARAAVLFCLGMGLVVMAICFVKSVLFGGGHDSQGNSNDD